MSDNFTKEQLESLRKMRDILVARINEADRRIEELEELRKQKIDLLLEKPIQSSKKYTDQTMTALDQSNKEDNSDFADELRRIAELKKDHIINEEEFNRLKEGVIEPIIIKSQYERHRVAEKMSSEGSNRASRFSDDDETSLLEKLARRSSGDDETNIREAAVVKVDEVADEWYKKGLASASVDRYEVALEQFDRAVALNPEVADLWYRKGLSLANLHRYEEALEQFDRALEINPNYADVLYIKGLVLAHLHRYEESLEQFDRALKLKPEDISVMSERVRILRKLGRYEESKKSG